MTLTEWSAYLRDHFAKLKVARATAQSGGLLFVLEHGLDREEVGDLETAVRTHIATTPPLEAHWLAWIVYATELGYRYAGDQYWQTFDAETPGWVEHGSRNWMREAFRRFQRDFGGARPQGQWAEHFSIISWPITHAILPLDLQRQMAALLYQHRHSLSAELLESPLRLGEWIEANSFGASARFRYLAEQVGLTGLIAAALLLDGRQSGELILAATLRRISQDLDVERRTRDWLKDARRQAQAYVELRGAARPRVVRPPAAPAAPRSLRPLDLRPQLLLRPGATPGGALELFAAIPSLLPLRSKSPELHDILARTRCFVSGASGRPLPTGWLLRGGDPVRLGRWPGGPKPFLELERASSVEQAALDAECSLDVGPLSLFRVATDGLAYQLRALRVRPSQTYFLLSAYELMPASFAIPVDLACDGVRALRLDVPSAPSSEFETWLLQQGLARTRMLEVWPAGLSAAAWDGEGRAEWLASEQVCIGIAADHALESLSLCLEPGSETALIGVVPSGESVFLELPRLAVGSHRLHAKATIRAPSRAEELVYAELEIIIREPRVWAAGYSPAAPLVLTVDPPNPTLEQLWQDLVELDLRGPSGRAVTCVVRLLERPGGNVLVERQLLDLPLPIDPARWRADFKRGFRDVRDAQTAYDLARVCDLRFDAGDLGSPRLSCEREFTPLRWAITADGECRRVVLLDDSGSGAPLEVCRHSIARPHVSQDLAEADASSAGLVVPADGGLFVASRGDFVAGIVLAATFLGVYPSVFITGRSEDAALTIVRAIRRWGAARLSGELLARASRDAVIRALTQALFGVLGGSEWESLEVAMERGEATLDDLKRAISTNRTNAGFGAALAGRLPDVAREAPSERVDRLALAAKAFLHLDAPPVVESLPVGVTVTRKTAADPGQPRWLCELALRLASAPATALDWAGPLLEPGIARLSRWPTVARAARYLSIAIKHVPRDVTQSVAQRDGGWSWP